MKKKEKNQDAQTKINKKRWGVGKTLAVLFSSVAFIVGAAILGVYLAKGFDEEILLPKDITFNEQDNANYNADLKRIEVTDDFTLTMGSSNSNITSKNVSLSFSYTYTYDSRTPDQEPVFKDEGWGIDEGDDYLDNGVIKIPKQVKIGESFTIALSTFPYYDSLTGNTVDLIRGGISTITATAKTTDKDYETISLTIAVDCPVYRTETVVVDANGDEISPTDGISEVIEEESFGVKTNFYPKASRYLYCDKTKEKTSYYQIRNVESSSITTVYDSSSTLYFEAEMISEGGVIDGFTAKNAKVQEQIEKEVSEIGLEQSNFEGIYNAFINKYSNAPADSVLLAPELKVNVVQASVSYFDVGKKGQKLSIFKEKDLILFVGDKAEGDGEFLSAEAKSNETKLNNILANVVLDFTYNGSDPTLGENPILKLHDNQGGALKATQINGKTYYFPNNPISSEDGQHDYGYGFWCLSVADGYYEEIIQVTVSLLLSDGAGGYQIFPSQHNLSLEIIEHIEQEVAWESTEDREVLLTYESESVEPIPSPLDLNNQVVIPEENIYKTIKYFASFGDLSEEEALSTALRMFGSAVESDLAGNYQTYEGSLYLIPLSVVGDVLMIREVGDFKLYFATIDGVESEKGLYNTVKFVDNPINVHVAKTLYINSVSSADVLYKRFDQNDFSEVSSEIFMPTYSDSADNNGQAEQQRDQLQLNFEISSDSVQVFKAEFEKGLIQLKLFSEEIDLTEYFLIVSQKIIENEDTAILTFVLRANSSLSVVGDINISSISLIYNSANVGEIIWPFENIYDNGSVTLYTPATGNIIFDNNLNGNYSVDQNLDNNGTFQTSIKRLDDQKEYGLFELISAIQEGITIIDQHGREETLCNSWVFTSNNNILKVVAGTDGIIGHGFSFNGGEGSATLGISCGKQSLFDIISFEITAQGITSIQYDSSDNPNINILSPLNADENQVQINKYGSANTTLTFNEMLKFFVGEEIPYEKISFKLSPSFLSFRTEEELTNLFGKDGILTINGGGTGVDDLESVSQADIQNISFTSLKINKNFNPGLNSDYKITFLVTDSSGAVNFTLVLCFLKNATVSAPSEVNQLKANESVVLNSSITYQFESGSYPKNLLESYASNENGKYYIVPSEQDENKFEIEYYKECPTDAIGEITEEKEILFYHFFKDERKTFSITFRPEGNNLYSTGYTILFNVERNINIKVINNKVDAFVDDQQSFSSFISIEGNGGPFVVDYSTSQSNNFIEIQDGGFTVSQQVRFDYNVTSLTQNINILIAKDTNSFLGEDVYQTEISLDIILPEDFWKDLADSLQKESSSSGPSYQVAGTNNTNYLVFEPTRYTVGSYEGYTIMPSMKDGDVSIGNYRVINENGKIVLSYIGSTADLLLGYQNQNVYTLFNFIKGEKTVTVIQPTIISQIGTTFVLYGDQGEDGDNNEKSLANALKTPAELVSSSTYREVDAGSTQKIYAEGQQNWGINRDFAINANIKMIEGAKVGTALPGDLLYSFDSNSGEIVINHLSDIYSSNVYLTLSYTISVGGSGATQTFNYLLKVIPNASVKQANYPYNGNAEYIEILNSSREINLDAPFENNTAKQGEKRFNVKDKYDETLYGLKYEDSIISVTTTTNNGRETFTDPSQWSTYITFIFNRNENDQSILTVQPKTTQTITFVVRRSYNGDNGQGQAVVGGTIDYTFILNDNSINYSVRIETDNDIENNVKDYTWNVNVWENNNSEATLSTEDRKDDKRIYLIENWNPEGSASSGTIIYSKMSFALHKGGDNVTVSGKDNSYKASVDGNSFEFNYNSANALFEVIYPTYLQKQYTFTATLYTELGELATINFVFNADAKETVNETTFDGGQDVAIGDIFSIQENGVPESVKDLTLENISATGDLGNFVQKSESGKSIQLASVIGDNSISGDLTITVSWGDNKSYTFTIPNFTIEPNLTANNYSIENRIAGGRTRLTSNNVNITEKETLSALNSEITLEIEDGFSNSAVECTNNNGTITISYNNVGSVTTVEVPVIITVTPSFGATTQSENVITTTKRIIVTIIIYPNVEISAVYPSPNAEDTLAVEYITDNTDYNSLEDDFLGSRAIFANKARIQVKYAALRDNKVVYESTSSSSIDIDKVVSIKALNNAIVTQFGESLKVNSIIDLNQTVTFSRGTSGGASTVTLSISYNNYVIDYEIEIQTNPFALSLNQASNNISADSSGQYEIIYVDKTNTTNLFAKNRMAQVVLSSNASAGDYYIVFENAGETSSYQISKVINLSENFVSLNKGKTIYLDLGNDGLGDVGNDSNIYVFTDVQYQKALEEKNTTDLGVAQYLVTNYSSKNLFSSMFTSFKLTARVSMTYGGWEVGYDNMSTDITLNPSGTSSTGLNLSGIGISSDVKIGETKDLISSFTFNSITFNTPYRYRPEIDIEVGIDGENDGYVTLLVQGSIDIVDAFNIRRASTQQRIDMDEMVSSEANFALKSIGVTNNVPDSTNYIFTSISPIRTDFINGEQYTYDYRIVGNGADNDGNYISYELTYTVGGFSKIFTLKVHIEPDYVFDFGGSNNTTTESDGAISNQNNPYKINTSEFTDREGKPASVEDLVLAGEDETAYLSITHGNSSTLGEQSVSAFNYTITVNNRVGDTTYNIDTNITSKLEMSDWTLDSTQNPNYYSWNKGVDDKSLILNVKAVELGTQYYRLEAVDNYGFKIYLYFELSSGEENPTIITSASSTLSFTEGDSVSFGAQYEEISLSEEDNIITVSPSTKTPNASINIRNIEAWGFTTDYSSAGFIEVTDTDGWYEKKDDYIFANADKVEKYFNVPNLKYITVDQIAYYYQNGDNKIKVGESVSGLGKELATNNALNPNNTMFINPDASTVTLPSVNPGSTWVFRDGDSVELDMVVRLKYSRDSSNTEYYEITQNITLKKKNTVSSKANLLADNTEIVLANYIDTKGGTIYDDTLAVAVQGNRSTSYTLTYENKSVTISETNGTNDYQKLYYRSISAQFDTVLTGGEVTITPHDEYATFYYGTSDSSSNSQVSLKKDANDQYVTTFEKQEGADYFRIETKNEDGVWTNYIATVGTYVYNGIEGGYPVGDNETTITITMTENFRVVYNGKYYYPQYTLTIASITSDLITVSNQKELALGEMQVQQYYVVTTSDEEQAYRYTQTYYVSGTFKEITYSGEIRTLPTAAGSIEISSWAEGIYYSMVGEIPEGTGEGTQTSIGYVTNPLKCYNGDNLYFVVTSGASGGGGTGLATIAPATGKITLLNGFTSEHFVTVEIYQKVSGIDGQYGSSDLSQMKLLKTIRLDPTISTST